MSIQVYNKVATHKNLGKFVVHNFVEILVGHKVFDKVVVHMVDKVDALENFGYVTTHKDIEKALLSLVS